MKIDDVTMKKRSSFCYGNVMVISYLVILLFCIISVLYADHGSFTRFNTLASSVWTTPSILERYQGACFISFILICIPSP